MRGVTSRKVRASANDHHEFLNRHFNADFYRTCYPDAGFAAGQELSHYRTQGWKTGHDPSPGFSTVDYLSDNPDVQASGRDPFEHYIRHGVAEGRRARPSRYGPAFRALASRPEIRDLFDRAYYVQQIGSQAPEIASLAAYLTDGWKAGVNPNRDFDTDFYLFYNAIDLPADMSPLEHYVGAGRALGFPTNQADGFIRAVAGAASTQLRPITKLLGAILRVQPQFLEKWKLDHFIATNLHRRDRWSLFAFHYAYLFDRLGDHQRDAILFHSPTLWRLDQAGLTYEVTLGGSNTIFWEGELSLDLLVDRKRLYTLSFSIAPGDLAGLHGRPTALVSRLQGIKGEFDAIHRATKDCHEISPAHLLFACLEGVAEALGVEDISGVSAQFQSSRGKVSPDELTQRYDRFFESLGMVNTTDAIYARPRDFSERPLSEIKASHRRRTRQKRQFKREIAEACKAALLTQ